MFNLFYKFKEYIIGAGLILASITYLYLKGKSDGKNEASRKAEEALRKDIQSSKEIKDDIDGMSIDELDSRLSDWTRKR